MTEPASTAAPPARIRPGGLWWIFLARACVAIVLGLSILLAGGSRPALINFIAIYWLVGAVLTVRWVFRNKWLPGTRLALVAAGVGVAAGLAVLFRGIARGIIGDEVFISLLGLSAILTGALRLSGGFHDDQVGTGPPRLRHRLPLGIIEVFLGAALILAGPESGWVRPVAGLWALAGGTLLFVDGLAMRRELAAQEREAP